MFTDINDIVPYSYHVIYVTPLVNPLYTQHLVALARTPRKMNLFCFTKIIH